jgi:hypothetical protein
LRFIEISFILPEFREANHDPSVDYRREPMIPTPDLQPEIFPLRKVQTLGP